MLPILVASRRHRGRRFFCGWCDRRRFTRCLMVEGRKWRLCRTCRDLFWAEP